MSVNSLMRILFTGENAFETTGSVEMIGVSTPEELLQHSNADAFIDFAFENNFERISVLERLLPTPVIINSVVATSGETHPDFTRINAWPGFSQNVVEAYSRNKEAAETIFGALNLQLAWLPDQPGFVSARVICMVINEAFLALEEAVSTPEEIDTAMKLGTNYPFGPFEWAEKIGKHQVYALLKRLAAEHHRYEPAPLLNPFLLH